MTLVEEWLLNLDDDTYDQVIAGLARRAILLLGSDKRDQWRTWYQDNIPIADDRFDTHLENLEKSDG